MVTKSFNAFNLQMTTLTEDLAYAYKTILDTEGYLPLPLGYIHVCDHYFQAYSSLHPLGNILCGASLVREVKYINGLGDQDSRHAYIW